MNDLHEVMHRATEHVSAPDLAAGAWQEARRRRTRRRAAVSVAGAAVLVAVVTVPLALTGEPDAAPPVDAPTSPTPGPDDPDDLAEGRTEATQPLWDPFDVVDAPRRDTVLPEALDPPDDPPSLDGQPLDGAVVAWPEEGRDLRLLGTDGEWRSLPGTANPSDTYSVPAVGLPSLRSDGERVAMSTLAGLLVVDVTTGEREVRPWPDEITPPWDVAPSLTWLSDDEVLVHHWQRPWILGPDGSSRPAPSGTGDPTTLAVDEDGSVLEHRWRRDELVRWDGERPERLLDFPWWGQRFVAGEGHVAFTGGSPLDGYDGGGAVGGPMVVDLASGELVGYAPIRDRDSVYTDNGYLTAQGFLDEQTVLLLVGPRDLRAAGPDEGAWHLVAWEWSSGDFELVSSGESQDMGRVDVATGLVE